MTSLSSTSTVTGRSGTSVSRRWRRLPSCSRIPVLAFLQRGPLQRFVDRNRHRHRPGPAPRPPASRPRSPGHQDPTGRGRRRRARDHDSQPGQHGTGQHPAHRPLPGLRHEPAPIGARFVKRLCWIAGARYAATNGSPRSSMPSTSRASYRGYPRMPRRSIESPDQLPAHRRRLGVHRPANGDAPVPHESIQIHPPSMVPATSGRFRLTGLPHTRPTSRRNLRNPR
jgi:hypothetical protein